MKCGDVIEVYGNNVADVVQKLEVAQTVERLSATQS